MTRTVYAVGGIGAAGCAWRMMDGRGADGWVCPLCRGRVRAVVRVVGRDGDVVRYTPHSPSLPQAFSLLSLHPLPRSLIPVSLPLDLPNSLNHSLIGISLSSLLSPSLSRTLALFLYLISALHPFSPSAFFPVHLPSAHPFPVSLAVPTYFPLRPCLPSTPSRLSF